MHSPVSDPADEARSSDLAPTRPIRGAAFALFVLFSMNLLNYVDRYIFASVGPAITSELGLSDTQFGYLAGAFMVVYTLVSPLIGWLGDRYHRRRLLAFGVGLWSIATVGTALAGSFREMFFWRALLGVGEASYGVVAPALLADLFPIHLRGRAIGSYALALPLGAALGYGLGGWIEPHLGWRTAFVVVGLPGLGLALAGLLIHDPGRGASDGLGRVTASARPRLRDMLALFLIPSFVFNVLGMAAVTFTTGAFGYWGPTFYHRVRHMPLKQANFWLGGLTAVAGLLGIVLGTSLADRMRTVTRRAYLLWAFIAVLLALPFGFIGILDPHPRTSLSLLFLAMVLLASVLGPCNAVPANVVPANRRAAAYAVNIFLIHLLGDISSPILIGAISEYCGRREVIDSEIGGLLAFLGARTTHRQNLTAGMLAVVPVLGLGALFFLIGSRFLGRDEDRARPTRLEGFTESPA